MSTLAGGLIGVPTAASGSSAAAVAPTSQDGGEGALPVTDKGVIFSDPNISGFAPGITRAPNGDLLVEFHTTGDVQPGGRLYLSRSHDNGQTWQPAVLLREPSGVFDGASMYSAEEFVTLKDGTILFAFNEGVNYSPYNNRDSVLYVARSTDSGYTWSGLDTPVTIPAPTREHWACCNLLQLHDGSLLMALWGTRDLTPDWQDNPMPWRAAVMRSFDDGRTWVDYRSVAFDPYNPPGANGDGSRGDGINEITLAQLKDGRIAAVIRDDARVGPNQGKTFYLSYSSDQGNSWTRPVQLSTPPLGPRGQSPRMATAPCGTSLGDDQNKLLLGYRVLSRLGRQPTAEEPYADLPAVAVSFDDGVTWPTRTVLESPDGLAPGDWRGGVTGFYQLDDRHVLVPFEYQANKTGTYQIVYNILEDAAASDCVRQAAVDAQRRAAEPSVFVVREDADDWPYPLSRRELTLPASSPVSDLVERGAGAVNCQAEHVQLLDESNAGRRLNPRLTLAMNQVHNGDVIEVRSVEPTPQNLDVGVTYLDRYPQGRQVYAWGGACDYGIDLDQANLSLGLRAKIPPGEELTSISLRDSDAETQLTADDYTLWVSDDNETYRPLQVEYGWVDQDFEPETGNLAHFERQGGFALDYRKRSVGVDLGRPVTVSEVVLRDTNEATRLTPRDLSVYVSDNNAGDWRLATDVQITQQPGSFVISGIDEVARYVKVAQPYTDSAYTFNNRFPQMMQVTTADGDEPQEWSFEAEVVDGRLVHTFTGLHVNARYIKINKLSAGGGTFHLDSLQRDVTVTVAPKAGR